MAGAVPPVGQYLAAVRVHQLAGGARWLAWLTGSPRVQQRGSPGEVHQTRTGVVDLLLGLFVTDKKKKHLVLPGAHIFFIVSFTFALPLRNSRPHPQQMMSVTWMRRSTTQ